MPWLHWSAVALHPHQPLSNDLVAADVWASVRSHFPDAAAAVIMPDHIHVLTPERNVDTTRSVFCGILGSISSRLRISPLWAPFTDPTPVRSRDHLRRTIRYLALNPARAGLEREPLAWQWSSYRDIMGLTISPWRGPIETIERLENRPISGLRVQIQDYVSSDPAVDVKGTPPPGPPAKPSVVPSYGIRDVLSAVAAAYFIPGRLIGRDSQARRYFCHLARLVGWHHQRSLAQTLGVSTRTIRRDFSAPAPRDLDAGLMCLGDERLHRRWRGS